MGGNESAPGVTRTPDLLIRSQTLYPTELRAHVRKSGINDILRQIGGQGRRAGFRAGPAAALAIFPWILSRRLRKSCS
jgi:hypothetical protein